VNAIAFSNVVVNYGLLICRNIVLPIRFYDC